LIIRRPVHKLLEQYRLHHQRNQVKSTKVFLSTNIEAKQIAGNYIFALSPQPQHSAFLISIVPLLSVQHFHICISSLVFDSCGKAYYHPYSKIDKVYKN
jgi:hypothetical protein